ncbi:MAG: tRNA uridine-5-carboxymethylaminomethyl(34) synthesis GTPase MnmE [Magnetococcus sp. YQC-9]
MQFLDRLLPLLRHPDGRIFEATAFIPRLMQRVHILDPQTNEPLDQAMAVYFPAPHSYTGEDVLELQGHGSPVIVQHILEILLQNGIRPAKPGEFTRRACLNGKMDLTRAEAVAALINSVSLRAAREAMRQLEGSLQTEIDQIRNQLLTVLAHLEATLDFADEDITPLPYSFMLSALSDCTERLGRLLRSAALGERLQEGFHLAIVGRPNVGKSSLFNRLLGRKRAIVSPFPGTTRDCIESRLELMGMPVILLDTAGLRDTTEPVEVEGIHVARERMHHADGVLWMLDATAGYTAQDAAIMQEIAGNPVIVVWNKMDLHPGDSELRTFEPFSTVRISTKTGDGLEALEQAIGRMVLPTPVGGDGSIILAVRQKEALTKAVRALIECESLIVHGKPGEILALPLRAALEALGELIGYVTHEDLLERIFSTFCIGK